MEAKTVPPPSDLPLSDETKTKTLNNGQPLLHTVKYLQQHGLDKLVKEFRLSYKRHTT
jgi:hypothetical protein